MTTKKVPLKYSTIEKARILEDVTEGQLLDGNHNILPRASLALQGMSKAPERQTNKVNRIGQSRNPEEMGFMFNSVPYEFGFELVVMCRGMNEANQIIEQVAPMFNPTVNIDIWDAGNLSEPTSIPVRLTDVQISSDDYAEYSTNVITVTFGISLSGNLYPPVKVLPRVKEFQMYVKKIVDAETNVDVSMSTWNVEGNP